MSTTQTHVEQLTVLHCYKCDMLFGFSEEFERRRRADHEGFYCPAGHIQYYLSESKVERLEREKKAIQEAKERSDAEGVRQRELRWHAERRVRSMRGVITKTKRRVGVGVCPCCNRYFSDLHRHMSGKHPDYSKGANE